MKLYKTKKYRVGEVVFEWDKTMSTWRSIDSTVGFVHQDNLIALGVVEVEEIKNCKKCYEEKNYWECPHQPDGNKPEDVYSHIIEWLYKDDNGHMVGSCEWRKTFIEMLKQELGVE